jgi:hypothetical protein
MTVIVRSAFLLAAGLACTLPTAPANAAANRTFVSALGNDANPCTISQPCRTMQAAFNATASNGEIEVLDPTGYGALTITRGISIQGHGWASMNAGPGGTAITINAGASDKVSLRGLIVEGFGSAITGIRFNTGATLTITDCMVRNFIGAGIDIEPTTPLSYTVADTQMLGNTSGITVLAQPGAKTDGTLRGVIASNNQGSGIFVDTALFDGDATTITIVLSTANGNGTGFSAQGANVQMLVRDSTASSNGVGIQALASATVRVGHSVVTANGTGLSGTPISSYGDNHIDGNNPDASATIVPITTH